MYAICNKCLIFVYNNKIFQIELAIELNKPLFIHERDAHEDLLQILDEFKGKLPPILVHCFTGSSEHALAYLDKGFYIGLTGGTFKPY